MGCGSSSAAGGGSTSARRSGSGAGGAPTPRRSEPETPDMGLSDLFDPVKFLGRGGTGDTWLFR
jgi:hypothetical protein